VGDALLTHANNKVVQRAGLQLYQAILLNASERSQKAFAKKIFRTVGENLQRNNDDPAICFSSYTILCSLADKMGDKLAPWIERILGMVLTTISQLFSAELVAKCFVLMEKLAVDRDALFTMAAHPRSILVFTDALGILHSKQLGATITAFEYMLRILEDDDAMHIVAENVAAQELNLLSYFKRVQKYMRRNANKFLKDAHDHEDTIDRGALEYWHQLFDFINNILTDTITELQEGEEEEGVVADADEDSGDSETEDASKPFNKSFILTQEQEAKKLAAQSGKVINTLSMKAEKDEFSASQHGQAAQHGGEEGILRAPSLDVTDSATAALEGEKREGKEGAADAVAAVVTAVGVLEEEDEEGLAAPSSSSSSSMTHTATTAVPIGIVGNSVTPSPFLVDSAHPPAMAALGVKALKDTTSKPSASVMAGITWENLQAQSEVRK
jgi:hypothetical protein